MNKWSLYIGKVSGIKIYIHWTFIFLLAWIAVNGIKAGENTETILYSLGFVLSIFLCVILHELGHALMAKRYHYTTRNIMLLPIGGIAQMDVIPETPKHELAVAFAGPLVNLLIALLLYPIVFWFGKVPTVLTTLLNTGDTFIFNLMVVNIGLAVFNLIPAFPMDGGRVFRALLAFRMERVKATAIAARTGQAIAAIFFFVGILYNPILAVISVFIFLMAQAESDHVRSNSMLHNYKVSDVIMHKYYSLDSADTIRDAAEALLDVQASDFLVMENGKVIGTLDRNRIIKAMINSGDSSLVTSAMNTNMKFLTADMPLDQVYSHLQLDSVLPVMDHGKLIGIVDANNILEFIMIRSADRQKSSKLYSKSLNLKTEVA
jgi:Zn-dependent protease